MATGGRIGNAGHAGGGPRTWNLYRNLGIEVPGSSDAPVSDEFWTVQEDDAPDWLTVVGSRR